MGYDLFAIKAEHWDEYGADSLSVLHEIKDDWYHDEKYDYSHRIWGNWRNGYLDDEQTIKLPSDLEHFFFEINTVWSAKDVIVRMRHFIENEKVHDSSEMESFLEWLEFWTKKDAQFYLSF